MTTGPLGRWLERLTGLERGERFQLKAVMFGVKEPGQLAANTLCSDLPFPTAVAWVTLEFSEFTPKPQFPNCNVENTTTWSLTHSYHPKIKGVPW